MAPECETIDAFHRGRFFVVQPRGKGHRAGMEAMVLASTVPLGFDGRLADFGAGSGAAGLAVASRCPEARVVLVEREPEMVRYAEASVRLDENILLRDRSTVLQADVALCGRERASSGLADNMFDFVIMNPPFNEAADRKTPDPLRVSAHVLDPGLFERWLRSAAAVMRPGGMVALVARPPSLADILAALSRRFGHIQIVPILPQQDMAAIRIVVRAKYGSRARLSILPALVLHEGQPCSSRRAEDIINGDATLFGD